jgi:hypothetical protein
VVEAASGVPPSIPVGAADGVARLDELAASLAAATNRTMILDRVVREAMTLLPTETAVVRSGGLAPDAPVFDQPEGTATIPLAIGTSYFGTLTIKAKPGRHFGPAERQLLLAIGRQCALAVDRLSLQQTAATSRPAPASAPAVADAALSPPSSEVAGIDRVVRDLRVLASLARSVTLPPAARIDETERTALAHLDELRDRVAR